MFFAEYRPGSLTDGSVVPIPEPDADAPRLEPEDGDLILVPALTFDRKGYRLGQGVSSAPMRCFPWAWPGTPCCWRKCPGKPMTVP